MDAELNSLLSSIRMSHKYSDADLSEACSKCSSIREVMTFLGMCRKSNSSHTHLSRRIAKLGIDVSHFNRRPLTNYGGGMRKKTAEEVLVNYPDALMCPKARVLRRALTEIGREYVCECGLPPEWRGNPLVLQVDHKDGDRTNCTPQNLRFLCPNCHAQTETFGLPKHKTKRTGYTSGHWFIAKLNGTLQHKTSGHGGKSKIRWPEPDALAAMVWESPVTKVAARLGVSNRAVAKRCRKLGIDVPGQGYWSKRGAQERN